jgi:hypothetical protein
MDLGKPLILVVIFLLRILFLVIVIDAQAFKVSVQHVAVLEVVVRGSLVVETRLFEHFVKNAPTGGSSRFLAVSGSDKVVSLGFALTLLVLLLLLPVAPLGAPVGALGFVVRALPLILVTTKDATNRLLAGGIVGDDVHQFVRSDGDIAA